MKPIDSEQNRTKCVCPNCLVFNDCSKIKKEIAFCAQTKSSCIKEAKDACICGSCPVYIENKLGGGYFCLSELNN